jgi:hypothetical protein
MQNDDWVEEYDDAPRDECDHDDYEIDILTGRAECNFCPHTWYLTSEEIEHEIQRQARYHEDMERENRRQWWSDLFWAARHPLATLHWELQKRGWFRPRALTDDEIPF